MSKKTILFIIDRLSMGGHTRVLLHLVNNIDKTKFETHLIVYHSDGEFQDNLLDSVTLHDLKSSRVQTGLFSLVKKIYEIKPDIAFFGIAHVSLTIAPFLYIVRKLLPDTIWVAREVAIVSYEVDFNEKNQHFFNWLYKTFYKNFDLIIAQSKYMKNDLMKNYNIPEEMITIIHNPVDIQKAEKLSKVPIDYPFQKDSIKLLNVGRLSDQKRQDKLLETLVKLNKKYTLTFVGIGENEQSLRAMTKELGLEDRVYFSLYQDNPYAYMKNADIFVLSSAYEGLPNVVLEANACGLPVVAFGCPGTAEVIVDGENGFLASCLDSQELIDAIEKAVSYTFDTQKIKSMVFEKYDKKIILKRYEDKFMELIDAKKE